MSEPSNFGTNEDRAPNWPEDDTPYWTLKCPRSEWDDPPYKPSTLPIHVERVELIKSITVEVVMWPIGLSYIKNSTCGLS